MTNVKHGGLAPYLGKTFKVAVTVVGYSKGNVNGGVYTTNVTDVVTGEILTDHVNFFGTDAKTLSKHFGKTVNLTVKAKVYTNGQKGIGLVMA